MKAFTIQSQCYRANGLNGTYYSIALTDDNGNVLKGFGDHISENSYGIRNVFKSEGSPFSDEDRFITIKEIILSESEFDSWVVEYTAKYQARESWFKAKDEMFGSTYDFLYKGSKNQQKENEKIYNTWINENPCPQAVNYYSFLQLVNEN